MSMEHLNYLLSMHNTVYTSFAFWASVLLLKMFLMSFLTAIQRFRHKAFSNPEDLTSVTKANDVRFDHPSVERVRRAHRNDMENILPYLIIGLMYIVTDPKKSIAVVLFRIAGVSRLLHTLVYAFGPVPQPCRFIAFGIAYLIQIYMGLHVFFFSVRYI